MAGAHAALSHPVLANPTLANPVLANPALGRAILLVAQAAGLDGLATRLADQLREAPDPDLPVLHPRGGFLLDPALVYAVARVEANFDPAASSGAGAHGLMQLMPVAARAVSAPGATARLHDPATNLQLGQKYLAYLARPDMAGDDLLRVLASYNSGPAAAQRWKLDAGGDPVLFLELIPADETRGFVQRTLGFMWAYAARLGRPAPSLQAMAAGAWPRFAPEQAGAAEPPRRRTATLH